MLTTKVFEAARTVPPGSEDQPLGITQGMGEGYWRFENWGVSQKRPKNWSKAASFWGIVPQSCMARSQGIFNTYRWQRETFLGDAR